MRKLPFTAQELRAGQRLQPARNFAPGTAGDTAGMANDVLAGYNAKGLLEIIEAAGCSNYAELVNLLYEIGTLADKQCEMGRIIEALDEIDSTPGY